jgi:hypothetical protein
MIQKVFKWLTQPLGLVALLIAAVAVFSLVVWGISQAQKPPEQPIQFPHQRHIAMQVPCLYCHPGALRGASPGIPTPSKCWGCHQNLGITATSVKLQPLKDAIANGTPLQWVPVAQVPDFVQFNHRPHIAAGVNCENCHGDLSKEDIYQNPQVMNMGWCLNCHKQKAADNPELYTKLTDCGTCHY